MAHLLTTRKRAVVLPDGSRALSEGDTPAGSRPTGSNEAGGGQEGLMPLFLQRVFF